MNEAVVYQVNDGIGTILLNRPERMNAVNGALMEGLLAATRRAWDDADAAVIIVTGAGKGFCAGGDIKEGSRDRASDVPEATRGARLRKMAEASRLLREMPKPVIAMINGPVAGAGIGIAAACDLRLAGRTAAFVSAYDRIGASGDYGATYLWSRILGAAKVRELFLLGERFTADEAQAFGIYTRVFDDDVLERETMAAARRLADGPRPAWAYLKANLNAAEEMNFARHLDLESANMGLSVRASALDRRARQGD
jgi:2-(1,2-epoxy-1,2-dihydrophenyl)acetyl-CoA isomerase